MKVGGGGGSPVGRSSNTQNVRKVTAAGQRDQTKDGKKGGDSGQGEQKKKSSKGHTIVGTDVSENQTIIDKERPNHVALSAPFPTLERFKGSTLSMGEIKTISFTLMRLEKQLSPQKFDEVMMKLVKSVKHAHFNAQDTHAVLVNKLKEFQQLMNQNLL